ncbi:carboxypeptidase C prc1 [Tritrichomonas musculus]|uniref:Carboxypeptidase C prc1 n=1 Tax=Tritrichomonas musculus TaxID=1915356 RepID=A0ABR2KD45_9EUKA
MKIEINIEAQLEEIWRDIGLKPNDIEKEYQNLNERVQELFKQFLRDNYQRRQALYDELETTQKDIADIQRKFALPPKELPQADSMPLVDKVRSLQLQLKTLQASTSNQKHEFESLFSQLTRCFEILEINDRGDFEELGDDYSKEKIERMSQFLEKMKSDINERTPEMQKLFLELQELRATLKLEPLEDTDKLGDQTFDAFEAEREKYIKKRDKNYRKCQKLYIEINRLEKVIGKNEMTQPNFDDISDNHVTLLKNKLRQLDYEKETRTPEYINSLKITLLQLWKDLHIKVPSKATFPYYYSTNLNKRTLIALENEVLRLETIKQQIQPTLELINDRQSIIDEYEKLQTEQENNAKRLTNRKSGAAMALLEEERIRKQYTYKLPKIHEQLIPLLEEYKENYGEPLLWDGEDLLEQVIEMHKKEELTERKTKSLTQKEIRNLEKSRTGRPLRTSTFINTPSSPSYSRNTTTKVTGKHYQNNSAINKTVI